MPALAPVMPKLTPLYKLDNWHNLLYLGEDWAVAACAVALSSLAKGTVWFPIAYVVALVLIGSRMRALMNLVHQASHWQLFANRALNDAAGRLLAAWPLLVSLAAYRDEHRRHHRWLWGSDDPKVARLLRLGLVDPPSRRLPFFWRQVVQPLMLRYSPANVMGAIRSASERCGRLAFAAGVVAVAVALGVERELLLYWLVPYVSTFQILRHWAEMAEHSGLKSDHSWAATRSWTAALPVRWLIAPHSDHWHLAHHLVSQVPHYRLSIAHRILMQVPQYADEGHHCDGLFFAHRPDAPSVISDLMHPETIERYRPVRTRAARRSASFRDLGERRVEHT